VLRAKIDMASPNMNLRDPIMYRIRHAHHHQTGDKWCIYPNYDFTHGQSDAIEGITHSICTLEFEGHRPLYEWFLDNLPVPAHPRQYEFSRLNLNYTITSKRKLKQLVDEKHVNGWDDPRMSTLSGFRRRGYTPASIRNFCEMIGTNRSDGVVDMAMLEFSIRDDLDRTAPRAMCVLRPLKVVITNYPEGQVEQLELPRHPKEDMGVRVLPFARESTSTATTSWKSRRRATSAWSRRRSAPARQLRDPCRRSDQGRRRQHRRAALLVRPGHPGQEP
jgi:glutaminyl-tRNA synthetase